MKGGLLKNMCEIKRVGALRGGWRVDCEKKCAKIKEGLGIKGQAGWCAKLRGLWRGWKKSAKLKGLVH